MDVTRSIFPNSKTDPTTVTEEGKTMLRVGLTGSLGSGKSILAAMMRSPGATIILD